MMTDFHTHILPHMDDGARDTQTAIEMLHCLEQQGIRRVVLTPHFYAHREASVADFLEKRRQTFERIRSALPAIEYRLGAEVSLEREVDECEGIEQLAVSGTNLILLEPSYYGFHHSALESVHNIAVGYHLRPVIAHIHRYVHIYTKEEMAQLLALDAAFQINADAFDDWKERRFVKTLLQSGREVVFGSDCHNMTDRRPRWDALQKRLRRYEARLNAANSMIEKYRCGEPAGV